MNSEQSEALHRLDRLDNPEEPRNRPQPQLVFNQPTDTLEIDVHEILSGWEARLEGISLLPDSKVNFENVLSPIAWILAETTSLQGRLSLHARVKEDKNEADKILTLFNEVQEWYPKKQASLAKKMCTAADKQKAKPKALNDEDSLFQDDFYAFKAGPFPDDQTRSAVQAEKQRLHSLLENLQTHCRHDPSRKPYAREDLIDPDTRKKAYLDSRSVDSNKATSLNDIVKSLNFIARCIGSKSHAHSVLEGTAMGTPENLLHFLDTLKHLLRPKAKNEIQSMIKRNQEDSHDPERKFSYWDYRFYSQVAREEILSIIYDHVFFPLELTMKKLLGHLQNMLGLRFFDITEDTPDLVWHQDVRVYSVWSEDTGNQASSFVGYLYLDLLSRSGKVDEKPAHYQVQRGYQDADHKYERIYPISVIVCSFELPPSPDDTCIRHDQVVTLLHELGHAAQNLTSSINYSKYHADQRSREISETASQLCEQFGWDAKVVEEIGQLRTNADPPLNTLNVLYNTRKINRATECWLQLGIAEFFVKLYTTEINQENGVLDVENLWFESVWMGLFHDPRTANDGNSIIDLSVEEIIEYDPLYYKYPFGDILASDMFHRFKKPPAGENVGMRWRTKVLQPGASKKPMELIHGFLDRPPSVEAFLKDMGLDIERSKIDMLDAMIADPSDPSWPLWSRIYRSCIGHRS